MKTKKSYQHQGMKVLDARKNQLLRVRAMDIHGAICRDHQACVLARTIKRQLKAKWVDVGASVILVKPPHGPIRRFMLGKLGREQVRFFDTHKGRYAPCDVT